MRKLEFDPPLHDVYQGLRRLRDCDYPGRIAIIGASRQRLHAHIAYALTGRSEESKDRILVDEGNGTIRTSSPSKTTEEMDQTKNAKLIYYRATRAGAGLHIVSNGAQTDPVYEKIEQGSTLEEAVRTAPTVDDIDLSKYEPDKPNYTPRITGVVDLRKDAPTPFGIAVVSKPFDDLTPDYAFYELGGRDLLPAEGVGYGIQTYSCDGDPLPSYNEAPFTFPLGYTAADTASIIWDELNPERRVAVAVHSINTFAAKVVETCIINGPSN